VIRTKENVVLQRRYSRAVDKSVGLRSDHTVVLTASESAKVIRTPSAGELFDAETNHDQIPDQQLHAFALTITHIYKCRWQIEFFFKWISSIWRIKAFFVPARTP